MDDSDLLKNSINNGESWVYGYDFETKVQSFQWKCAEEPRPQKPSQVRLNVKVLLTVFFDCNWIVRRLCEAINQKRTELWKNQSWILRHDNAPAHTSILVLEFLAKNKIVFI